LSESTEAKISQKDILQDFSEFFTMYFENMAYLYLFSYKMYPDQILFSEGLLRFEK